MNKTIKWIHYNNFILKYISRIVLLIVELVVIINLK